jgi:glutamate formiminotransferase/formiminotetrahydrofolate cyclodeaminase
MVANLSAHKRGWDHRWEEFSDWAERGISLQKRLLSLVDADAEAFQGILTAHRMPSGAPEEAARRDRAVEAALRHAIEIPLEVMEASAAAFEVLEAMAAEGLSSSVSDAAAGALLARAAVRAAGYNVRINAAGLERGAAPLLERAANLEAAAAEAAGRVLDTVDRRIDGD